jgi:hypothetical protein
MIKISELQSGDYVWVNNMGATMDGEVLEVNSMQKKALVRTNGQQDFWYEEADLGPVALNDEALLKLNFSKVEEPDGWVKYMKGAFRNHLDQKNDFSNLNFWYREDRRHVPGQIALHQLQNYYNSMTKVHLTDLPI